VKTENPSACATVNWKMCKSTIPLYSLYLRVIKRECVTNVLINPIIRTRTRHFCRVYPLRFFVLDYNTTLAPFKGSTSVVQLDS
jgi:hypothetical protein